jgi:hypothetical protein
MKKIMITLFLIMIFSSLVVAEEYLSDENVDDSNIVNCVNNCKEVICVKEGEECRSKCISGCKKDSDELKCLSCGDGCLPYDIAIRADCLPPTNEEPICGAKNGKCVVLNFEEDSFFEEFEFDLTEKELEEIRNSGIDSAGITPDSPFYFIDEVFASLFGEDREEKIAEIISMIEKEDYESARVAMKKYGNHVDKYVKQASPENREVARDEAVRIHQILKQMEEKIPPEYKEEFIDSIIESEKVVVTAVEIASKIKELCESLAELDPVEYSSVCKTDDESPNWQKKLDKELTKEQREEAEKFGNIMAECFESSGENCRCSEIPFPQFAEACSRAAPLAQACELENDEKACKKLDNFQMPRLPPHLEEVMKELDGKVMESKFDLHMPPECEGVKSAKECEKIMIETHAPEECKEALLAADVDNEREGRKICDQIMMEKHAPECAEKGITDPEECTKFMDNFRKDDFKDYNQGPKIDFNCKEISDPGERLECFDKASSQAKGYKGHNDKDYDGVCMTESDWKDKKQECRDLYGVHAGDEPIMGDSGDGYECVIDAKCVDFGYKDDYVAPEECKNVGALSKEACEKHRSDVAKLGPGCDDCESQCPGASRTDCVNDRCECYYEDKKPEYEDNDDSESDDSSSTDSESDNDDSESDDSSSTDSGSDNDDSESDDSSSTDSESDNDDSESDDNSEDSSNSESDDSSSTDSESEDSSSDESESSNSGSDGITGNVFLDYWYT